jgi:hypothetical protein
MEIQIMYTDKVGLWGEGNRKKQRTKGSEEGSPDEGEVIRKKGRKRANVNEKRSKRRRRNSGLENMKQTESIKLNQMKTK